MRTAAICSHRLRAEARRYPATTEVAEDRAVPRQRSASAARAGRSQDEKHVPGRCPHVRQPIDLAASQVVTKEEVSVEHGHGLVVVTQGPACARVPVVETRMGCQHELPAPRYPIRELEI